MTTAKQTFKCPDCDKEFDNFRALGPHRNKVHGYRVSDGKNNPRRAQGSSMAPVHRLAGKFPCPHCDFVANWKGGLTKHVGALHPEFVDAMRSPRTTRAHTTSSGPYQCPECERSFSAPTALGAHRLKAHGIPGTAISSVKERERKERQLAKTNQNAITITASNGHVPVPAPTQDDHRLEAAATYAAGRVAQLLESIALQYEIPHRAFTSLVLRTVGETTKVR